MLDLFNDDPLMGGAHLLSAGAGAAAATGPAFDGASTSALTLPGGPAAMPAACATPDQPPRGSPALPPPPMRKCGADSFRAKAAAGWRERGADPFRAKAAAGGRKRGADPFRATAAAGGRERGADPFRAKAVAGASGKRRAVGEQGHPKRSRTAAGPGADASTAHAVAGPNHITMPHGARESDLPELQLQPLLPAPSPGQAAAPGAASTAAPATAEAAVAKDMGSGASRAREVRRRAANDKPRQPRLPRLSMLQEATTWKLSWNGSAEPALLGRGAFGAVTLIMHRKTGELRARKTDHKGKESLRHEVAAADWLAQSPHRNVVTPLAVVLGAGPATPRAVHYELAQSSLAQLWERHRGILPAATTTSLAADMLRGLAHLHHLGCFHRDIKPDNMLLFFDAQTPLALKIADFGWVGACADPSLHTPGCVSAPYRPPEILMGEPYDFSADAWVSDFGAQWPGHVHSHFELVGAFALINICHS